MKRYISFTFALALGVSSLLMTSRAFAQFSASTASNGGDKTYASPSVLLPNPNRGVVFKTAGINSDGTFASRFSGVSSAHLGAGIYQVVFDTNVQAAQGWARWVQVDTLGIGSIANVSCTTADRYGVPNGVWVACYNAAGAPVDTSFFLFVAR